jgi:hypothetical protein
LSIISPTAIAACLGINGTELMRISKTLVQKFKVQEFKVGSDWDRLNL